MTDEARSRLRRCPMPTTQVNKFAAAVLTAATLAGCDVAGIEAGIAPAGRVWVVTVENRSPRPALLLVAEDTGPAGRVVGNVNPGVVPAGVTADVTFGIPSGKGWAIWVNRGPNTGPLVTAHDVPENATGRMPFKIIIDADGNPGSQMPGPACPG